MDVYVDVLLNLILVVMFLLNITRAFASSGTSGECFDKNPTDEFSIVRNIQSNNENTEVNLNNRGKLT